MARHLTRDLDTAAAHALGQLHHGRKIGKAVQDSLGEMRQNEAAEAANAFEAAAKQWPAPHRVPARMRVDSDESGCLWPASSCKVEP